MAASVIGNVFSFKPLKAARLEDMKFPVAYVKKPLPARPPVSSWSASGWTSSPPLLGATTKPKLGLSGRNYGRVVYEGPQGRPGFHEGRREHQLAALHALA